MGNQPREIEIKLRIDAKTASALRQRLAAILPVIQRQSDLHFRIPGRVLRFREQDGAWVMTRKGEVVLFPDGTRSREELEDPVPATVIPLLTETFEWLGCPRSVQVNTVREAYHLDGMTCCIDEVEGLDGLFVELEMIDAEGADDAEERIRTWRDRLGLSACEVETRGYAHLVAERQDLRG